MAGILSNMYWGSLFYRFISENFAIYTEGDNGKPFGAIVCTPFTQFIDASALFKKATNNNVLTDENIEKVMQVFDTKNDVEYFSKICKRHRNSR